MTSNIKILFTFFAMRSEADHCILIYFCILFIVWKRNGILAKYDFVTSVSVHQFFIVVYTSFLYDVHWEERQIISGTPFTNIVSVRKYSNMP